MKNILTILFLLLISPLVIAQNMLDDAMKAYQDQDYVTAMKLIETVVATKEHAEDPYAWHVKGYIYKDYFKKIELEKSSSPNRQIAIEAYINSRKFDKNNEYIVNNLGNLKYLAVSYYNDAVRSMDTVNYKNAESYYAKYKEYYSMNDPNMNYDKSDISFYNALATVSSKKYDSRNASTNKYFDETVNIYKKVLGIDSTECFANEQIGILFYNKGVDLIMNIDIETIDPSDILSKQEECNDYWKISLPYLLKAYNYCAGTPEEKFTIIEGIKGIYWGMDMKENFDVWDKLQKKTDPNNGDK